MQYKSSTLFTTALFGSALSAYVPSEPWTTLTPTAAAPTGAITDYTKTFGIAVVPLETASSTASHQKRDVITQIGDGQIQATTTTKTTATAQPITQIGDGQIQATTKTETKAPTAQPITQIGDGQIQATTKTEESKATAQPITQIGDGQIQATTKTVSTAQPVTQIGDGQIQATTTTGASTVSNGTTILASSTSSEASLPSESAGSFIKQEACLTSSSLAMTLHDGILTDSKGRIGSIVANRQFQFDGPPPQAGAIYAKGWSITEDGNLAMGSSDVFYQCLSGSFYNLYDESLGAQCTKIHLEVVDLVSC